MRKTLIIIVMALFAMPVLAQTIETVNVSKVPNGKYTTTTNEGVIEGYVNNGQKVGTWIEYFNGNVYLPKKIVSYENGKRDAVSELLPSLDDFERIVSNADKADDAWVEGVKLVYRKFTDELKKLGLAEIEAEGKFDPNLHNAVLSEAADGVESETILAVLQKGYKMGDKILRHSMVKVSE